MRKLYFLLIPFIFACQSSGSSSGLPSDLKPLYEEVLKIHDEVMPEMSTLTALQTQVTEKLQEQRAQEPINTDQLKETNRVLGGLNRAESAMWDWMHNFGKLDSIPADEKRHFLEGEKLSAQNMKELVLSSMKEAKEYMEQNPLAKNEN